MYKKGCPLERSRLAAHLGAKGRGSPCLPRLPLTPSWLAAVEFRRPRTLAAEQHRGGAMRTMIRGRAIRKDIIITNSHSDGTFPSPSLICTNTEVLQ